MLGLLVAGGALVKIQKEEAYQARMAQAQTTAPADFGEACGVRTRRYAADNAASGAAHPQAKPGETTGSAP